MEILWCLIILHSSLFHEFFASYQFDISLSTEYIRDWPVPRRQYYLSDLNAFSPHNGFIRFGIHGSPGARLTMESAHKTEARQTTYYYIFIGTFGNTKSLILLVNDTVSKRDYFAKHRKAMVDGAPLSKSEWRYFWVSWCDGTIQVGKGIEFNKNLIMSWTNPCPFKVVDIGITNGRDAALNWRFQSTTVKLANEEVCPLKNNQCNLFSRTPRCPIFRILLSTHEKRSDCALLCSDDVSCWAFSHDNVSGKCDLLSGEVEQTTTMSTVFLKRQI